MTFGDISPAFAIAGSAMRRERGMARWRARSRLIRRLRVALPVGMAAILALLAAWVGLDAILARIGDARPAGQALIHMTNAQFLGRDGGGRPYVLTAAEASRDDNDLKLVMLKRPTLTLDSDSDRPSRVSADSGLYREDDRVVRLSGHVALRNGEGDLFRTERATADTVRGTVVGPVPVSGAGPAGQISANSFDVYDRGARVVFRGEVHSRMNRD